MKQVMTSNLLDSVMNSVIFVTPLPSPSSLTFKPYFVSYNPNSPALLVRSLPPIGLPDYVLGVGEGRFLLLVDEPSPEPTREFFEFCERITIGHTPTNSKNVRH